MIYAYKCKQCLTVFEVDKRPSEPSRDIPCPQCTSTDTYHYLGAYGTRPVLFKGTGFAINDMALSRIGMPEATQNSPEAKRKLFR